VPLLGTLASQNTKSFSSVDWIARLDSADAEYGYDIAYDGTGNYYVIRTIFSVPGVGILTKYNLNGAVQWQKSIATGGSNYFYSDSVSYGNGYVYVTARIGTAEQGFIGKFDTSGNIVWQKQLGISGGQVVWVYGSVSDSSDNVYVTGISTPGGIESSFLAKFDSAGALQWQRHINAGTGQTDGYSVAIDTSTGVYVAARTTEGGGYSMGVHKYNTSGALQWQRRLGTTSQTAFVFDIATDSSNNVYAIGKQSANAVDLLLAKWNSSGTLQWQRKLGDANLNSGEGIAIDSSDNVYVSGNDQGLNLLIAKYNSAGTIQWQRKITPSTGTLEEVGMGITIGSTGHFGVVTFELGLTLVLPTDGSKTGTYTLNGTDYVYSVATFTDAAATHTNTTSTLTDSAGTMTVTTPTNTSTTSNHTHTIVSI